MRRRRWGHLLFILFQAFWLNVVIPGHTRGAIPLAGASRTWAACCRDASHQKSAPVKSHGCAICSFAAQLSTPPAVVCEAPPLLPLARAEREKGGSLIGRFAIVPFDGRGPPLG